MIWLSLLMAALAVGLLVFRNVGHPHARPRMGFATLGLGFLASMLAAFSTVVTVPAGHVGVPILFGKVQDRNLSEGLHFINPFTQVVSMTVRTETYTMSSVRDEGAVKGDDSITALSADGLMMPLDVTLAYRLVPTDAPWLYRSIGPDFVDKVIRPASRTAVREAIAGFTAQEAYSNRPRLPNEPILCPMSRQSKFHRTTCSLSAAYDDVDRAFAFAAYVVFDYVTVLRPMF